MSDDNKTILQYLSVETCTLANESKLFLIFETIY